MKTYLAIPHRDTGIFKTEVTEDTIVISRWKLDESWSKPGDLVATLCCKNFDIEVNGEADVFTMGVIVQILHKVDPDLFTRFKTVRIEEYED